ncbi:MAG: uracil-DNA glycosylase [Oscillospiraceae bacterium]|jgi:DNA polymerase|nr:uracil-DNA glycosylase [Oscillospiraceae bacterium]
MLSWEELETACNNCTKCELHKTRTNVVLGVGNRMSELLFVGEGPGESEDLKGEPFVGRAGKLLDDMLKIIGLSRENNIYIANIVKCRPPGNRDPQNTERETCINWLHAQFALIKPKIVVCLGRIAAMEIIDQGFKITRDHGKWYEKDGIKFMALYHPAALLRDPHKRPDTFIDLKELERMIKEICVRTL